MNDIVFAEGEIFRFVSFIGQTFLLCKPENSFNNIVKFNMDVTLFLQKERDLELAARIGQTLLTKNQELEDQLNIVIDKVRK